MRIQQPYVLIHRTLSSGKRVFYVRFAGESSAISTGVTNRSKAEDFARQRLKNRARTTLGELLTTAYDWDACPHVRRLRSEGKQITRQHADNQRKLLTDYVANDYLCSQPIAAITRGDILGLRDRIRLQTTAGQTNRVIGALKVVLEELVYRQQLERNPCAGVDRIATKAKVVGVLEPQELKKLFEAKPGFWGHYQAYAAFLLAATTGMRRGEILALTWKQVEFDASAIAVDRAFKGDEVGSPKWGKLRRTYLSDPVKLALLEVRNRSQHILPESLVFCDAQGRRRGGTW